MRVEVNIEGLRYLNQKIENDQPGAKHIWTQHQLGVINQLRRRQLYTHTHPATEI